MVFAFSTVESDFGVVTFFWRAGANVRAASMILGMTGAWAFLGCSARHFNIAGGIVIAEPTSKGAVTSNFAGPALL